MEVAPSITHDQAIAFLTSKHNLADPNKTVWFINDNDEEAHQYVVKLFGSKGFHMDSMEYNDPEYGKTTVYWYTKKLTYPTGGPDAPKEERHFGRDIRNEDPATKQYWLDRKQSWSQFAKMRDTGLKRKAAREKREGIQRARKRYKWERAAPAPEDIDLGRFDPPISYVDGPSMVEGGGIQPLSWNSIQKATGAHVVDGNGTKKPLSFAVVKKATGANLVNGSGISPINFEVLPRMPVEDNSKKKGGKRMPRKKYPAYFAEQDSDKQQAIIAKLLDKREKELTQKKKGKGRRNYKKKYRRAKRSGYGGGGKGGGGNNIIYPNVIGRGPYHIGGDFSFGQPDSWLRGKIGGSYSSHDYVTGSGPYTIRRNSFYTAADLGTAPPKVVNVGREAFILRHREFLGDLLSGPSVPTNFTLAKYPINPGNPNLFPFAAPIATRFQEYEITGMFIELKTLAADFSTQFALGSVFMATDYNVLNIAPSKKQTLENMEYSCSCKPSQSLIHWIECDPANTTLGSTHRYIATNGDYQGGDQRLYDLGNLFIGSEGLPNADAHIAEIWISYEIALYKPILEEDSGTTGIGCHYNFVAPTPSDPLGSEESFWGYNGFEITDRKNIVIPPIEGYYQVFIHWSGETQVGNDPTVPGFGVSGSATLVSGQWAGANDPTAGSYAICNEGTAGVALMLVMTIKMTRPAAPVPFNVGVIALQTNGVFWDESCSGNVTVQKINATNVGL